MNSQTGQSSDAAQARPALTNAERERLRSFARAATPGSWSAEHRGYDVYENQTAHGDVVAEAGLRIVDAAYIAAADPPTVLALLDDLDAVTAARAADRDALLNLIDDLRRRTCDVCHIADPERFAMDCHACRITLGFIERLRALATPPAAPGTPEADGDDR